MLSKSPSDQGFRYMVLSITKKTLKIIREGLHHVVAKSSSKFMSTSSLTSCGL